MARDNKKAKADPAPKNETPKDKSTSGEALSKSDGGQAAAAPSNYSRGKARTG
jgi:hypothetical protein